jgi:hypothetical protein
MQTFPVEIEPEQIVRWVIAERQAAPSKYRAIARRAKEVREMPAGKELRLGDAECDDLSEVASVASVQIAPIFPNKDWRLTITVEDEIGPPIPDEGAEAEAEEEEIDIAAFYEEFIRSGWGNATVIAEAESPAAKARMMRLLGDIERDHHAQHRKEA